MPDSRSTKPPSDSPADLADLVGRAILPPDLRDARPLVKLDWVLSLPDPKAFVADLGNEELYLLFQDIGRGDAYPLLEYATPAQMRGLVDLDAWRGSELVLPRWLEWLDLALAADTDVAIRFVEAQDDELLEWLFIKDVQVHPSDFDRDEVPDELAVLDSPDGLYLVSVPHEHPMADRARQIMKLLWAADMDRARVIFQQAQFDLPASVEEYMGFFRAGRLQDMGFDTPEDAPAVFSAINPEGLRDALRRRLVDERPRRSAIDAHDASGLVLRGATPPDLLAAAAAGLDGEARGAFAQGFTFLVNRVFLATTQDLSRTDDLPLAGRHAAFLTNLGLQFASDDDVEIATRILERAWPVELFQLGHSLTLRLALKARRVLRRAGTDHGLSLFGSPSDEALQAVGLARPLLFEGAVDSARLGYRPFATLAELARIEGMVDDAHEVLRFFETDLGFSPEAIFEAPSIAALSDESRRHIRLATLFRTGLAHALLSDVFRFAPLDRADLEAFARAAFTRDGTLSRVVEGALAGTREGAHEAVGRFIDAAMQELVATLGRVRSDDLETRFVSELLLVSGD